MTDLSSSSWAERLHGAGLRVTAARLAVLRAVQDAPHADVEHIAAWARRQIGSLSTQAVYDNLDAFATAGLVRRVEPAGSPARYETRTGDNHHHVVCRRCGTAADVDCVVGAAPCLAASNASGYLIDEAEVTFWGVCPTCQASEQ